MQLKSALTLVLGLALAAPGTSQLPPAAIHVLVLEEGTETPISGAELWLAARNQEEPRSAMTGGDGTAWIRNLPPGPYHLQINSRMHRSYRERRPDDATVPPPPNPNASVSIQEPGAADVVLRAGTTTKITFRLPRGGVIAGTVKDGDRPASGARVVLLQDVGSATETHPTVGRVHEVTTGPDGAFEFSGLAAGKYRLAANPGRTRRLDDIYYPGVTGIQSSEPLAIELGERRDVIFPIKELPINLVSGRVVDEYAGVGRRELVSRRLDVDTGDTIMNAIIPLGEDGAFVAHMERARHGLIYTRHGQGRAVVAAAFHTLRVGDEPTSYIELRPQPVASMSGTFVFRGGQRPDDDDRLTVNPWPIGTDATLRSGLHGTVTTDNTFRLDSLLGAYRISVATPRGWLADAVLLDDGRDILHKEFAVIPSHHYSGVRVVLTNEVASIVGSVRGAGGKNSGPSLMVIAFPVDSAGWAFWDQKATGDVSNDGRFEIADVRVNQEYFVALCEWPCPTGIAQNTQRAKAAARVNVDRPGTYRVVLQR